MAAVMLFQGRFGMTTTQMAIQAATAVEPRIGESGHGHGVLHEGECARAGDLEHQPKIQQILRADEFGALERRQSRLQPKPGTTRSDERADSVAPRPSQAAARVAEWQAATTVTAVRIASMPMRRAPCFATSSAIRTVSLRAARDRRVPTAPQDASGRLGARARGLGLDLRGGSHGHQRSIPTTSGPFLPRRRYTVTGSSPGLFAARLDRCRQILRIIAERRHPAAGRVRQRSGSAVPSQLAQRTEYSRAVCDAGALAEILERQPAIHDAELVERQDARKPRVGDLVPSLDQTRGDPLSRSRVAVFTGFDERPDFVVGERGYLLGRPERVFAIHPQKRRIRIVRISTKAGRKTRSRTVPTPVQFRIVRARPSRHAETERQVSSAVPLL